MKHSFSTQKAAESMAKIWETHDKRDFPALKESASELFQELGFSEQSKRMAEHTMNAYRLHAEIDDKLSEKKMTPAIKEQVMDYKKKIEAELSEVFRLGHIKNYKSIGKEHAAWWIKFLLKNATKNKIHYASTLWHLFQQQYQKIGKLIPAIQATYWLLWASLKGHNKRDHKALVKGLNHFWTITSKYDNVPLMV